VVLAPLGWLGYVACVAVRTGRLDGYFAVQRGWGSEFDWGAFSAQYARNLVIGRAYLVSHVALVLVWAAVVLYAHLLVSRVPLPLAVYSGVLLFISLGGTNYFQCKPRFLLPAFVLLLPVAHALARARPRTALLVLSALGLTSAWYGTYLLTVSPYAL
jgi:hypothetical protein